MVLAADLDTLLLLERRVDDKGKRGGVKPRYEQEGIVWARVEELRAAERVAATRVKGVRTAKLTMRYQPGLTYRHRLRDDDMGRTYHVDGFQHTRRSDETIVTAVETA